MYSKIVVCLNEKEDEVLTKQIEMLKERHKAEVDRVAVDEGSAYLSSCDTSILFICDDSVLLDQAKGRGIATNDPAKMRESYAKAMEMLKAMGMKREV